MKFEEFEIEYLTKILDNKPKDIRAGQALMNFLADVWKSEYLRISSLDHYKKTNIDCFYNNRLIPNTLEHLKEQWKNYPN